MPYCNKSYFCKCFPRGRKRCAGKEYTIGIGTMMNAENILQVTKRHLLLANAVVWGAPGVKVLVTGIRSYLAIWPSKHIVWLVLGTICVLAGFNWMFCRIVKRYSNRVLAFPEEKKSILAFLPARGWILVVFMMCLGVSLKFIPGIPAEFFASFYPGLGIALLVAGAMFLAKWTEAASSSSARPTD